MITPSGTTVTSKKARTSFWVKGKEFSFSFHVSVSDVRVQITQSIYIVIMVFARIFKYQPREYRGVSAGLEP